MFKNNIFPKYFVVDDLLVIVSKDGEWIEGKTYGGRPFPPYKALVEGQEVFEGDMVDCVGVKRVTRPITSLQATEILKFFRDRSRS